jgi:hypothetical protein
MIDGLDRMSLEDVLDWHDLMMANDEAEAEQRRKAQRK